MMEKLSIRDQRQREFAHEYVNSDRFNILHLAPRTGKCRVGVFIFNALHVKNILIAYPDEKIRKSWEDEFKICNYPSDGIVFTTYLSLRKHTEEDYDLIVADECHLMSENQISVAQEMFRNKQVLGLSGTLSKETRKVLLQSLQLPVLVNYPIEQAIKEGVIADYEISVVKVPLDNRIKQYKGKTEKQKFDNISWVIEKLVNEEKDTFFLRLQRMRIIQNSVAKKNKTISLLKEYENERVLVFAGIIKIASSLGICSFTSKSFEKDIFTDFVEGRINHLAVCKIGNTGVTYFSLNRIIINYFDSNSENLAQKLNRAMSFEYDNPDKVAKITIISSNEEVELKWLKKALEFFDKSKITYI